jgi:hypothetical protein
MLAVILKNTILVVLMICIGFFLIDNHLQEVSNELKLKIAKEPEAKKNLNKTNSNTKYSPIKEIIESSSDDVSTSCTIDSESNEGLPSADDNISRAMKIRIDDNMKEIYEYVFGDSEASDDLKNMYETPEVPDKGEVCSTTDTTEIKRYDNMCKDPIQDHHDKVDYQYISMEPASNKSLLNIVEDSKLEIAA